MLFWREQHSEQHSTYNFDPRNRTLSDYSIASNFFSIFPLSDTWSFK